MAARSPGRTVRRRHRRSPVPRSPAARLREAEQLFREFAALTPYRYRPFVKTFGSFEAYERWRHAQKNPWYR